MSDAPTLTFGGWSVEHFGKGKNGTLEVRCAACGDQVAVAGRDDEERALALADENRQRNACCVCSIVAIIAEALDNGSGLAEDEVDAAKDVVASLVRYGWRFRQEGRGTVHPRLP